MVEYHRIGLGEHFQYRADELEDALEKHPQLSKQIPGGYLLLEKHSDSYKAEIVRGGRETLEFYANTIPALLEQVRAEMERAGGEEGPDTRGTIE
jgi:hypothetical protein